VLLVATRIYCGLDLLAHQALVGLAEGFIQREEVYGFGNEK
jgi:hypothetical protein